MNPVLKNMTQPAFVGGAAGIVIGNLIETSLIKSQRPTFGVLAFRDGTPAVVAPKPDGTPDVTQPAPGLELNRQLLRGALVIGALAFIAYGPKSEAVQSVAMGIAAVEFAHIVQGVVPGLK